MAMSSVRRSSAWRAAGRWAPPAPAAADGAESGSGGPEEPPEETSATLAADDTSSAAPAADADAAAARTSTARRARWCVLPLGLSRGSNHIFSPSSSSITTKCSKGRDRGDRGSIVFQKHCFQERRGRGLGRFRQCKRVLAEGQVEQGLGRRYQGLCGSARAASLRDPWQAGSGVTRASRLRGGAQWT